MKLKTIIFAFSSCLMAYYVTTEYAKEPKAAQKTAFTTIGLWRRQEFTRRLLEDARKKMLLTAINPKKNQKDSK